MLTKIAKFRDIADRMSEQIENKRNPGVVQQRVTQRRAGIIERMAADADKLEAVQMKLYAIASTIDAGTLPDSLNQIKSKADVERLLQQSELPVLYVWAAHDSMKVARAKEVKAFARMGIETPAQFDQAKLDLGAIGGDVVRSEAELRIEEIQKLERELIGQQIPGYFPTPEKIVRRMIQEADIHVGMRVLEPSAGKGNIADIIRQMYPGVYLTVNEWNAGLNKILSKKGYVNHLTVIDFLTMKGEYDRIIMNPPFERGQDIEHVQHAYDLLAPVGKVVSIMSEGTFGRADKKATAFREWLKEVGWAFIKLPADSFYSSERPTGVVTRMVIIDKEN